ncbi:NADH-plastoquinone oxidoreductase subunit [Roseivivax jejudonensis]|uniref:NADH-plastoquinone oxidoreductase subunit n=1 Tax=Roseivivax jejudonensis TaxID=1529041 RepID=A0A1X7A7L8_9RHOB|nr:4Fe-4S binding protein [Roseivivax jejudonensis]SLN72698.1 NADH-plastoquinone oxidoreductase subunit [Roseivivax jejudonensis]
MPQRILLCDCLGSQSVDPDRIAAATGLETSRVYTALCTREAEAAAREIADGETLVACGQEGAFFDMLAEEIGATEPARVDLRDRAGWSDEGRTAGPKQAALAAEALLTVPATRTRDITSEGTCLILGPGEAAFEAAARLCDALAVTVLLTDAETPPPDRRFDVVRGRLARAEGALGGFTLRIDGFQALEPGGRGAFGFTEPRDGAASECDILLDLTGDAALFPAPHKREGYLRADPRKPGALIEVCATARELVGTFEKPLYVRTEAALCAHSRARQTGCTRCLDVCPTGAIQPDGDHVRVDPMICAGCGACAALCPSAAIAYDAPSAATMFRRIETLARSYREASGGAAPRLLVHDDDHGAEMIRLSARFGRGLPADVIPLDLPALAAFGHAEMTAALSAGFAGVDVLLSPRTERATPEYETALANAIAGGPRVRLLDLADPDALPEALYDADVAPAVAEPSLPLGTRRQVTRLAAQKLNPEGGVIALPDGAPYGAVLCDTDACTLCLACVSLCPSGALGDNPDRPELLFQEDACLQCGICASACPEDAITLAPRLDLSPDALSQRVLNEEEPAACVECGALFGVQSTIDRIADQLAGKHAMFANSDAARMIRMCDDCRVRAQYHSANNPFAAGDRPRVRTTEDYLSESPSKRRDH